MGNRLGLTPQEMARLGLLGPTTPDPRVPAIGVSAPRQIAQAPGPQFLTQGGGGSAGGSIGAGGGQIGSSGVVPNLAGPSFAIDPISATGLGIGAAGTIASTIGGFFKKGPSFSEKTAGLKSSLPARSRIPFSPEQREMLPQLFADMNQRLMEIKTRTDPLSEFAQGVEYNSEAISDLKNRALAFRDRAAAKRDQGA